MLIAGAWHTGFAQSATTKTHPPAKPPLDARWILDYPKEDNTSDNSDVRRDPKYLPFLKTYLTQKSFFSAGPRSLWQVASEFLGVGSGRVTIYAQRYATINGCVAHMCDELQGFLWVDTVAKPPRVYFAATKAIDSQGTVEIQKSFQLWIFANQALNDDDNGGLEPLPTEFLGPLSDWLGQLNVAAVMFVGHVGEEIPLLPGSLHTKQSTNDSAKGSI
jgi:hypothetical protein